MTIPVPVVVGTLIAIIGLLMSCWWTRQTVNRYRGTLQLEIEQRFIEFEKLSNRILYMNKKLWIRLFDYKRSICKESKRSLYYRQKGWIEYQKRKVLTRYRL